MSGMARALPCLARAGDGVHLNVLEQPNRQTGFSAKQIEKPETAWTW